MQILPRFQSSRMLSCSDLKNKEVLQFITVLDRYRHYYTKTMMYNVRIEYVEPITGLPIVKFVVCTEDEMVKLMAKAS